MQPRANKTGQWGGHERSSALKMCESIFVIQSIAASSVSDWTAMQSMIPVIAVIAIKDRNDSCSRFGLLRQRSTITAVESTSKTQTMEFVARASISQLHSAADRSSLGKATCFPNSRPCSIGQPNPVSVKFANPLVAISRSSRSQSSRPTTRSTNTSHVSQCSRYHGRFGTESIPRV